MNTLETCLLVAGIPAVLVVAGYWLAVRLVAESAASRLAVAMLGGLGVLIWTVSVVNLARGDGMKSGGSSMTGVLVLVSGPRRTDADATPLWSNGTVTLMQGPPASRHRLAR